MNKKQQLLVQLNTHTRTVLFSFVRTIEYEWKAKSIAKVYEIHTTNSHSQCAINTYTK